MQSRVAYIASVARSGSTLLGLLLKEHPAVVDAGEADWARPYLIGDYRRLCTCGAPLKQCAFWQAVRDRFGDLAAQDPTFGHMARLPWRRSLGRVAAWSGLPVAERAACQVAARHALRWLQAVAEVANRPVVVDASKSVTRLHFLHHAAPDRVAVVHLVRDGRAIAWSRMRRHKLGMAKAASYWLANTLALDLALQRIADPQVFLLRYETLCTAPQSELNRLAIWLGLQPFVLPPHIGRHNAHVLGGNPMRMEADNRDVVLDAAWQTALSTRDLAVFDAIAGWRNRKLGYRD